MSGISFPNESDDYRKARNKLLKAEIDLRQQLADVAKERQRLPAGGDVPEDYVFQRLGADNNAENVMLSELFENHHTSLLIYSFMFGPAMQQPCPMCTSMLNALNGNARQIRERISIAVVARSPIERVSEFASKQGWDQLPMVSSAANSYQRDYFGETEDGAQMPMANVFIKGQDHIRHFWGAEMLYASLDGQPRHVDLLWPLWNAFDLTPDGRGSDWYPTP